jgi:tape measure domain-containing protein
MPATDLERLVVQLSADITKYERAMARASSVGNKQLASIERRALSMNKNLASSFTSLGAKLGLALAAAFSVKGLAELQDAYTKIQNSLKVAGLSGKELTGVYNQLYAAAQKNAAPIESLATLYSRVSLVQKELGVSSGQVVGLVENVAKSLKAQGSSAAEAQGALLQLGQALGGGTVQAEEYGSLIDGLPVLLQAAAAGIKQAGGSVAKLTQLVKSGQISNKALFDGIAVGSSTIDDKLKGAAQTADSAMLTLRNALTNAAGRFDAASGSSEKFGSAVGAVVTYLDNASFDNFILGINNVIIALDSGIAKFTTFLAQAGKAAGVDTMGFTDTSRQNNAINDYFDGTTAAGQKLAAEKQTAEDRLSIEKQIAELKANPVGNQEILRDLEQQRDAIKQARQEAAASGPGAVHKPQQGPLNYQGPLKPAANADKVDITDAKYKPTATSGSGSKTKKAKLDDYEREVKQVQERTDALNAATDAQSKLNPYVNDYGFNVERAATAQDLLTAAQNAGTAAGKELQNVQQLLSGNFDGLSPKAREQAQAMLLLANTAGQAAAKSQEVADSQDKLRQSMEDWRDVSKDATRGFIQDLVDGKSAVEALGGALQKIGDKLLDGALEGLFGGSGSNNWFSSLLSGFSKGGSVVKAATGGQIRGPGTSTSDSIPAALSDGEFVVNAGATKRNRALLEAINSGSALKLAAGGGVNLPRVRTGVAANTVTAPVSIAIDARGADADGLARVEMQLARLRADIPGTVVTTVKDAQKRRML